MYFWFKDMIEFSTLKGKVIDEILIGTYLGEDAIIFKTRDKSYIMIHDQECCESVTIDDICGDLNDIIGEEVVVATEDQNEENPNEEKLEYSFTWTFYHIETFHGDVTIKWFGTSNGYYSEDASLYEIDESDDILTSIKISKRYGTD